MSVIVYQFQPVVPANTLKTAPYTLPMKFPAYEVDRIRVKVPPGPRGTMGFALGSSGFPVIPFALGTWIIADNDDLVFETDDYPNSGSWEFFGYNLGQFAHTLYITFEVSLVAQPVAPVVVIPSAALSSPAPVLVVAPEPTPAPEVPVTIPAPPTLPPLVPITISTPPPITVPAPPL